VASVQVGAVPRTAAQHDRRARIIEAATALLAERDYDRIQIRHVAEEAGVALDTLYRYFPSKEQLYAHVLLDWSEGFPVATRRRPTTEEATDEARLRATLHRAVRAYERRPTFYRLITALEAVQDPATVEVYRQFSRRFEGTMLDALADTDDDDAKIIGLAASALLHARLGSWSQGRASLTEVHADLDAFVAVVFSRPRARATPRYRAR
jgi:AcrR family transcriptional regulator